jgi:LPPG:FO 2-phospho-L-lactate transferase
VVGPSQLTVIANTADDVEVYGVHVSPDPDLVTYWLADLIDERGYGIRGDTWSVMEALESAGRPAWFRLGDRDLAMCLVRTEALNAGARLTEAQAEVGRAAGVEARVLPMSDEPVRSVVRSDGVDRPLQEFMILDRAQGPIEGVRLEGIERARPSPEVLVALAAAEAILIGPSNPVISIGPILSLPGLRDALATAAAPVVAVSPFVGGKVVKGPTEAFVRYAGLPTRAEAVVEAYGEVLDGVVADEAVDRVPHLVTDTLMEDAASRERVAEGTLEFAEALAGTG